MDTNRIHPNMNAAIGSTTLAPEGKFNSPMYCMSQVNPQLLSFLQVLVKPKAKDAGLKRNFRDYV